MTSQATAAKPAQWMLRLAHIADWSGVVSGAACVLLTFLCHLFLLLFMTPRTQNALTIYHLWGYLQIFTVISWIISSWLSFGICEAAVVVYILYRHEGARVPWIGFIGFIFVLSIPFIGGNSWF